MYSVTYLFDGEPRTAPFMTELEAVRWISQVELYRNLEIVSYSDNIDRSKYRY